MPIKQRVAAVTGSNKGIGLAIVRNIALQYPSSPFASGPLLIYLTARSPERGVEAVQTLNADPQLKKARALERDSGPTTIEFAELDISQTKSIHAFRDMLKSRHPEGIDVVVNNAGIALQGFNEEVVRKTLETNYYGPLEMMQNLLPLLRHGGRIVNVSSVVGRLNKYSDAIRSAFLEASRRDVPAVTALMEQFQKAVADGREKEAGFPSMAYAVSKTGVTAMTQAIANDEAKRGRGVLINACCPGFVNTDMTKGRGVFTPDQGARTPVILALQDIGSKTGKFWSNGVEVEP